LKHEQTTGIILRTRLLTETSLIVHWLTPQFGRIATVARGARRPKSPFRGKLDLFYMADFDFIRSRRSDLHVLTDVSLRQTHEALRGDLVRLEQAAYAVALLEQTTETETPLPNEFQLLSEFVGTVASRRPAPVHVLAFELKLLLLLGQAPHLPATSLREGSRGLADRLGRRPWEELSQLTVNPEHTRELQQFLHGFLIYHLGKIPRGRAKALAGR
jgi:DNA repair protein RecO (recombination protein O)